MFLSVHYKDMIYTVKTLVKDTRVTNIRAVIVILGGFLLAIIKLTELVNFSFLFNLTVYYILFIILLPLSAYWLFKNIRTKEKRTPFSKVFINNQFCIEELIIYLIIIINLFPFGIELINRNNNKFNFYFSLISSNNFAEGASFSPYTIIDNKLNIINNSDITYNIDVDTYYTQYADISSDSKVLEKYFFCDFDSLVNGEHYFKHVLISMHSQIELNIVSGKAIIPNFISFPFDVDSIRLFFNKNDFNSFYNYTKDRSLDIGLTGGYGAKGKAKYKFPDYHMKWPFQFSINWISRISLRDDEGNQKKFLFKGSFTHAAAVIIINEKNYFAPGYAIDYCSVYPKYVEDNKIINLPLNCFIGRFNADKLKMNSVYSIEEFNIGTKSNTDDFLFNNDKRHTLIYATLVYVSDQNIFNVLMDMVLEDKYISYDDSLGINNKK